MECLQLKAEIIERDQYAQTLYHLNKTICKKWDYEVKKLKEMNEAMQSRVDVLAEENDKLRQSRRELQENILTGLALKKEKAPLGNDIRSLQAINFGLQKENNELLSQVYQVQQQNAELRDNALQLATKDSYIHLHTEKESLRLRVNILIRVNEGLEKKNSELLSDNNGIIARLQKENGELWERLTLCVFAKTCPKSFISENTALKHKNAELVNECCFRAEQVVKADKLYQAVKEYQAWKDSQCPTACAVD